MSEPAKKPGWTLPKPLVAALALTLAALLGVLDYLTGSELAVSALYLGPICWACWRAGRTAGLVLAVVSGILWLAGELMGRAAYTQSWIPYWNAFMLLVFFVVVVMLLSAFQTAHQYLEDKVARRTAALQAEIAERKRLENAKLRSERLAVVGTMAAQVAHEVRNPLGSITLNLDLVATEIGALAETSGHSAQEARTLLEDMRAEVRRIQRVIEDYLKFARLPNLQRQPVALNEWLDAKLGFMGAAFAEDRVSLRTDYDPALGVVQVDAEQLWQAILNLIRNGLEAMSEGGTLTVSTRREGDWAVLRVTDTGRGMAEEQAQQVFVPFFTSKPDGTGLGLGLTLQVVNEHGGQLDFVSAVGKGTTFTIQLPLKGKS